MDKAPAYGAGDSGFESQYGLNSFSPSFLGLVQLFFCLHAREDVPRPISLFLKRL
jgi:hypothetical protein